MAGEVTRRQQKQVEAEDPPVFLGGGTRDVGREKWGNELNVRKDYSSDASSKVTDCIDKGASRWTRARWKNGKIQMKHE